MAENHESSYQYDENEINAVAGYLQECARKQRMVHYDDAFEVASHYGTFHGPHDARLWALLGEISEREVKAGRDALSALVTVKATGMPGEGFFRLEQELGRYKVDDVTTWCDEVKNLFEYWSKH